MTAYYNEIDPYAAQWLRNLISAGHITPGDVDERSVVDVRADELARYTQCHFFAGIGGWSLALRLAGWPDDRSVWTGSCPCQPFSAAGAGKAADDERHLWPAWFPLIAQCRPAIVFGEQVEAAIGWGWLDAVFADLEGEGYACGTTVLPACGIGAPHIRQRCWFMADTDGGHASAEGLQRSGEYGQQQEDGGIMRMAISQGEQFNGGWNEGAGGRQFANGRCPYMHECSCSKPCGRWILGDTLHAERRQEAKARQDVEYRSDAGRQETSSRQRLAGPNSNWYCDWFPCTDGKARPVEPGTFPLAHGIPGRVGRLRAYGNAIVPQVAAEFIKASLHR